MITLKPWAPGSEVYVLQQPDQPDMTAHKCKGTEGKFFVRGEGSYTCRDFHIYNTEDYLFTIITHPDEMDETKNISDQFFVFYNQFSDIRRFGVVNRAFEIIIPPVLETAQVVCQKYIKYSINGKYGLYNEKLLERISPEYEDLYQVQNFILAAKQGRFPNLFWDNWMDCWESRFHCKEDGEVTMQDCHIFNCEGKLSCEESFDNIYVEFDQHIVRPKHAPQYEYNAEIGLCIVKKGDEIRYGIISRNGDFRVPPIYDHLEIIKDQEINGIAKPKLIKYGVDVQYDFGGLGMHDITRYRYDGGLWGVLSLDGDVIITAYYDGLLVYGNYIRVRKGNKFGLYDVNGRLLLDTIYSSICILKKNDEIELVRYSLDGKCLELPKDVDSTNTFVSFGSLSYSGRRQVIEGGKWGYYDLKANKQTGPIYSEIGNFKEGRALVKINDAYYYINEDFDVVSRPFEDLEMATMFFYDYK